MLDLIADGKFREIFDANEGLQLLHARFFGERDEINWRGMNPEIGRKELMLYQRLLRLCLPVAGDGEAAVDIAERLIKSGLTSAHHIASWSEKQFVKEHGDALGLDEATLVALHRAAVTTKIRTRHLWANFRGTAASPHFRAGQINNMQTSVTDLLQEMPDYQDFFGSLDYCACEHCKSIFSPAAFLVDTLRVVYEYIENDTYNPAIPPELQLATRRPDIAQIPLTCDMTNDTVPTIQVVNEVLDATIKRTATTNDVPRQISKLVYPFNAPFNLPLNQTRVYTKALGRSLWEVYNTLTPDAGGGAAAWLPTVATTAREQLGLSPTQFAQVSTPLTREADICDQYGLRYSKPLTFVAVGTVSVTKGANTVTGQGTRFESDVLSEEMVLLGPERRVVKTIVNDTQLETTAPFSEDQTDVAMTVIPTLDLAMSVNFNEQTGLEFAGLTDLLTQNLSAAEFAAGLADGMFINEGAAPDKYLAITTDKSVPEAPLSVIANLTLTGLDQLNRFIRLSAYSGVDYESLGWALAQIGGNKINADFATILSSVVRIAEQSKLSLIETMGLFRPLKTTGSGSGETPQNLFDRVFNSPSILGVPTGVSPPFLAKGSVAIAATTTVTGTGTDFANQVAIGMRITIDGQLRVIASVDIAAQTLTVTEAFTKTTTGKKLQVFPSAKTPVDALPLYHPTYKDNPLFTDPVLSWDLSGDTGKTAAIEGRLAAGLEVSGEDLVALGTLCQQAGRLASSKPVSLDVINLSRLYAYARSARLAKMSVLEFVKLMDLLELTEIDSLTTLLLILENAEWIKASRIDPFALEYIIQGETNRFFDPSFSKDQVTDFLNATWAMAASWRVGPETFVNEDITPEISASYLVALTAQQPPFLSAHGIATDITPGFSKIAFVNPLDARSFETGMINATESAAAFKALSDPTNGILLPNGVMAAGFSRKTDLSYLFPKNPNQDVMIAEVQLILLQVQRRINYVVETLRTFGQTSISDPASQGRQVTALCEQFAAFLKSDADQIAAIAAFVAKEMSMKDFVSVFLRPPASTIPDTIWAYMQILSRASVAIDQFGLTPDKITAIIATPDAYGITDFSKPDLGQLSQLWTLKVLQDAFVDTENALLTYFVTPTSGTCDKDPKFALLSRITGWSQTAICQVIETYIPNSQDFNSVAGVAAMQRIFGLGSELGMDVDALFGLAKLSKLNSDPNDLAWNSYIDAASSTQSLLSSRYSEIEWPAVARPLEDQIAEMWRDVQVRYAIWLLQLSLPMLRNTDDLYDYLLIDTETSGCDDISYIKQATLSVQLYMQRSRMMLEPAITKVDIPTIWWAWLSSYRVWEANRKVFLYPENYLEPELRVDKTPLFAEAQQSLSANEVTENSVTDLYVGYFDKFSKLASLQQVGSFYGPAPDPYVPGTTVDTLFILGRTTNEPYEYHSQRLLSGTQWTAWEPIDAKIPSPNAVPVYVYNRLFLFWTEQEGSSVAMFTGGTNTNHQATSASIKYSFINHAGRWSVPQTMWTKPITFLPMIANYSTEGVKLDSYEPATIPWNTVSPYLLADPTTKEPILMLSYGWYFSPSSQTAAPVAPPPEVLLDTDAKTVAMQAFDTSNKAFALYTAGATGEIFVNDALFLDAQLNVSGTTTLAMNYDSDPGAGATMPYIPFLPRTVMGPGHPPLLQMLQSENIFMTYLNGQGSGLIAPKNPPVVLLQNISDRAGSAAPTINQPLWYIFGNGDESFLVQTQEPGLVRLDQTSSMVEALQGLKNTTGLVSGAYTPTPQNFDAIKWGFLRLSTGAVDRMSKALFANGVSGLLAVDTQVTPATPKLPFGRFYSGGVPSPAIVPPTLPDGDTIDYDGPYGPYYWELYLFIPWMVANALKASRRYADAKTWMEFLFNPAIEKGSDPTANTPQDRFWRMLKLRDFDVKKLVEDLADPAQIKAYNDHPFDPNAIARLRSGAYQKAVVMRYIDILLEWGDAEYTKDTRESINTAQLLYTLARDLLGPQPVNVGTCSSQDPKSFADIQTEYSGGEIPQFLVGLENTLTVLSLDGSASTPDRYIPYNDLNSYFCAPENEQLLKYWDLIEDRLTKIRNCMNIQGIVRKLALFEPALDPAALVGAAARGGGLQVANLWQPTAPPYRFRAVVALAKELTQQLIGIGGSLLAALEKQDAEELTLIRTRQEEKLLQLNTRVRELQIQEVDASLAALQVSRQSALTRQVHYQRLLDDGLSVGEIINLEATVLAGIVNTQAGLMKALSSIAHLIPNGGSPFAMTYGGREIGASLGAAASVFEAVGTFMQTIAVSSGTLASYQRRDQEWTLQAGQAALDATQIAAQIEASQASKESAERQLAVHEASIADNTEIDRFLRSKFTNVELYQWMVGRISSVYFQTFNLAQEMAMAAEIAYQFELISTDKFVQFDYWSGLHRGLMAGEQLMLNLNQMESSYLNNHARTFEIEKTVSLLSLDPAVMLNFREKGFCEFSLSEALFDRDFPGHFGRQIKSVSITIPAIVGPYQNIHATLTQLGNQTLIKADKPGVAFLLGEDDTAPRSDILRVNWRANQRIALSSGTDDNGLFELNFNDERYLPFEGTGAVSSWRLEMPKSDNLIDYASITDVVVRLRYTAYDGGQAYADYVRGILSNIPYLLKRTFALAQEYPAQWYAFLHPAKAAKSQSFELTMPREAFPANVTLETVGQLFFQLVLVPGATLGGTLKATLNVGTGTSAWSKDVKFANKTESVLSGLKLTDWVEEPWTLTVALADIPSGLRDSNGQIDAEKLFSINMIVTCEAKTQTQRADVGNPALRISADQLSNTKIN